MDNSLSLARYFARLVWLLVHEGQSVDDQKAALRAAVTVSNDSSVRLGNKKTLLAVKTATSCRRRSPACRNSPSGFRSTA